MFHSRLLKHRLIVTHSSHCNSSQEMQYHHTHEESNAKSLSFSETLHRESLWFFLTQPPVLNIYQKSLLIQQESHRQILNGWFAFQIKTAIAWPGDPFRPRGRLLERGVLGRPPNTPAFTENLSSEMDSKALLMLFIDNSSTTLDIVVKYSFTSFREK